MAASPIFRRLALIGVGLIGSSIARVVRREGIAAEIVGADISASARSDLAELGICERVVADPAQAVQDADLVMICTPLGTYAEVGQAIAPHLDRDLSGTLPARNCRRLDGREGRSNAAPP